MVIMSVPDINSILDIPNLKNEFKLKWSYNSGLRIINKGGIDDESNE